MKSFREIYFTITYDYVCKEKTVTCGELIFSDALPPQSAFLSVPKLSVISSRNDRDLVVKLSSQFLNNHESSPLIKTAM